MPTAVWPVVDYNGDDYYEVPGFTLVSIDPTGDIYFLVKTPDGGLGSVGPLVKGDGGKHTEFQETVSLTVLAFDDPAPATADVVEITPGDDDTSQVVQLALALHEGPPGVDGDTVLTVGDFDDVAAGKAIVVNGAEDGFELATQKVGDRYFPATIASTASGNATKTLAQVSIPAQDFDWRPEAHASCEVEGTGPDVKVDLLARLGTTGISSPETAGNIVGRALGRTVGAELVDTPVMIPGPDSGAAADHDKVLAGNAAVVYLRAERQTGADYFTTVGGTGTSARTRFWVKVNAIP